jgi:hypothetical protein
VLAKLNESRFPLVEGEIFADCAPLVGHKRGTLGEYVNSAFGNVAKDRGFDFVDALEAIGAREQGEEKVILKEKLKNKKNESA